jgi:hypothetical protein
MPILHQQQDHPLPAAARLIADEVADQVLGLFLQLDVAVAQDPERAVASTE